MIKFRWKHHTQIVNDYLDPTTLPSSRAFEEVKVEWSEWVALDPERRWIMWIEDDE